MSRYSVVSVSAKQKKRRKLVVNFTTFICIFFALAIALALWIYWKSMTPAILDIAESRLTAETTRVINEAVCSVLAERDNYNDFITIDKNGDGEIILLSANSAVVNTLARKTAVLAQSKINAIVGYDVNIPLGTLSGIPLLAEKGPDVNINVTPIGTVSCEFTSTFETAGINQTLHRIYINVNSSIDIIIPTSHKVVASSTPILLCESVIVGKVPQTFLQGGLLLGQS